MENWTDLVLMVCSLKNSYLTKSKSIFEYLPTNEHCSVIDFMELVYSSY